MNSPDISSSQIAPKIIHFIWLADEAEKELSLLSYIALKSAKLYHPDFQVILHSNVEPNGICWQLIQNDICLRTTNAPNSVFSRNIERIQHKVDVLRLTILIEYGGIYLDLDTICLKSLDRFRTSKVVIGKESDRGICNAMIAAPADAKFLQLWQDGYRNFHNDQWVEFSGILPLSLSQARSELVQIEPKETFFWPSFDTEGLQDLFVRTKDFPDAVIFHLWSVLAGAYLSSISIKTIYEEDSTYNLAARLVVGQDKEQLERGTFHMSETTHKFLRDLSEERSMFKRIYEQSAWGKGSGNGSHPNATVEYRKFLEDFITKNGVTSIVDVGCGDWQSSRYISFNGARYIGLDIVESLIEANSARFGSECIKFEVMPDDPSKLPPSDLLIMKDVLQHLTDEQIIFYRDFVMPRYRFCLITNSWKAINYPQNTAISPGHFRSLDLQTAPYFFNGAYVSESWNEWERIRTLLTINPLTK